MPRKTPVTALYRTVPAADSCAAKRSSLSQRESDGEEMVIVKIKVADGARRGEGRGEKKKRAREV